MSKLFLVRHGESEWNAQGLWTGWTDVNLTDKGYAEAAQAGEQLKGEPIDKIYVSDMKRAQQTLEKISEVAGLQGVERVVSPAIKERSYGIYTGKNKWQIKEEVGDEQFLRIRRSWDEPIPEGKTMENVYQRVEPYYMQNIEPELKQGKNVLIVAHGNSLRALMKKLEQVSNEAVGQLEIGTGEVVVYTLDQEGQVVNKEVKK